MEQTAAQLLIDVAFCIVFAAAFSHIARLLKQPPILGYVAAGLLLGPHVGFRLIQDSASVHLISEAGLIFFLFTIGLEINLREMKRLGRSVVIVGLVQMVVCTLLGIGVFSLFGMGAAPGKLDLIYLGFGFSMTSTLVVVKLLEDKFEVATTAGRLTLGILLLQDLAAIAFISLQPYLTSPQLSQLIRSVGLGLVLIVLAFAGSRYLLAPLLRSAAKSSELVLLSAVAWCLMISGLAEAWGLSRSTGALLAGVSIASFPYGTEVIAQISGLRNLFVTLFFVSLGLQAPVPAWGLVAAALGVAGFVLLSRLISVIPAAVLSGEGLRTGVVTALNLSAVCEFSLVIWVLGIRYGHVTPGLESLPLMSMLATSVLATYFIGFNDSMARHVLNVAAALGWKERSGEGTRQDKDIPASPSRDIVLLGCFRTGQSLLRLIDREAPQLKKRMLVVDYNSSLQPDLEKRGYHWAYADLAHPQTLKDLGLESASVILCSLSETFLKGITLERLIENVQQLAPKAQLIVMADDAVRAQGLLQKGAEQVIVPDELAAQELLALLGRKMFSVIPLQ